jgi:vacuolar-type H+-ATPase subunit I/STV1
MMTAEEAAEAAKGLNFEKVWAMFQETGMQIREMSREADRRQAEIDRRQAEIDRRQAEIDRRRAEIDRQQAETGMQIKELSKNIGGLNNSFGKWAEEMVSAKLWEKFKALGYTFTRGGPMKFWENDRTVAQVDMLLENGDYAMPVEIKSELTVDDVDDHLERIGKLREQLDKRGDRRKLVGAVAGMVVRGNVREYAQKKGLYVLVQSGDSVSLAEVPEGFKPREW